MGNEKEQANLLVKGAESLNKTREYVGKTEASAAKSHENVTKAETSLVKAEESLVKAEESLANADDKKIAKAEKKVNKATNKVKTAKDTLADKQGRAAQADIEVTKVKATLGKAQVAYENLEDVIANEDDGVTKSDAAFDALREQEANAKGISGIAKNLSSSGTWLGNRVKAGAEFVVESKVGRGVKGAVDGYVGVENAKDAADRLKGRAQDAKGGLKGRAKDAKDGLLEKGSGFIKDKLGSVDGPENEGEGPLAPQEQQLANVEPAILDIESRSVTNAPDLTNVFVAAVNNTPVVAVVEPVSSPAPSVSHGMNGMA